MSAHSWNAMASAALAATVYLAPQGAPEVFDRLHGEWQGDGTLMARPALFSMKWDHADGFAVLSFGNAFTDTSGSPTPVLNARAIYRTSLDAPEGIWLDSRGTRIELAWEASDSALVATWKAPTESGRTTYRVRSADELEVVDEVQMENGLRVFGRARYRRADASE